MASLVASLSARFAAVSEVFASVARKWIADSEPDEPPITSLMGAFGRALVEHAESLTDAELRAALDTVESSLTLGTQQEQDAVATGLLEAVLSAGDRAPSRRARVLGFAGPQALAYCRAWDEFTGVDSGIKVR